MTKLYYDNAIDALFMAVKFGVKFEIENSYLSISDLTYGVRHVAQGKPSDEKCYIAPESLEIFEPREGDVIQANREFFPYKELVSKEDCEKCLNGKLDFLKIIQRNNIPFIMASKEK